MHQLLLLLFIPVIHVQFFKLFFCAFFLIIILRRHRINNPLCFRPASKNQKKEQYKIKMEERKGFYILLQYYNYYLVHYIAN